MFAADETRTLLDRVRGHLLARVPLPPTDPAAEPLRPLEFGVWVAAVRDYCEAERCHAEAVRAAGQRIEAVPRVPPNPADNPQLQDNSRRPFAGVGR